MSMKNETSKYALFWGFRVFPIEPGGAEPLIDDWQSDASRDLKQIDEWWQRWPDANIGLITGDPMLGKEGNPGLVVIEVEENPNFWAGYASREADLPFLVVETRSGAHLYFATPEPIASIELSRTLRVKSRLDYVVAPRPR